MDVVVVDAIAGATSTEVTAAVSLAAVRRDLPGPFAPATGREPVFCRDAAGPLARDAAGRDVLGRAEVAGLRLADFFAMFASISLRDQFCKNHLHGVHHR